MTDICITVEEVLVKKLNKAVMRRDDVAFSTLLGIYTERHHDLGELAFKLRLSSKELHDKLVGGDTFTEDDMAVVLDTLNLRFVIE